MKLLKRILIIVGVVVLALVIVSQFLPSKYHVERSVIIAARPMVVFPWVNNLRKWPEWTPWSAAKDPTIVYSYDGPEEGVGAVTRWDSKKWGDGQMKIVEADAAKLLKLDLSFAKGKYTCTAVFKFDPAGTDTKVTWSMDGIVSRNPIDRFFSLMMNKMVGPDFEQGLTNLKKNVEGK